MTFPRCNDVEKTLTFREKVGVDDKLVRSWLWRRERERRDGRWKKGERREEIAISSIEVIHG